MRGFSKCGVWLTPPSKRKPIPWHQPSTPTEPNSPATPAAEPEIKKCRKLSVVEITPLGNLSQVVPSSQLSQTRLAKLAEQSREARETDAMRRAHVESISWRSWDQKRREIKDYYCGYMGGGLPSYVFD